ncbi:MAG: hypothetical protein FJ170_08590, partial [Gammaproteobacteria bacterium]|nr:hypothetical protein [Gammaproteobacteria bacterium]
MIRSSTTAAGLMAGFFMSAAFATGTPWTIAGNRIIPSEDLTLLAGTDPDGVQIAGRIVQAYRDRGYFTVEAQVDPAAHTIRVIEASAKASGPYAGYLAAAGDGVVTREDLELAAARMTPAARLNGERVQIDIRPADTRTGAVEIQTATVPIEDYKAGGFAAVFSTYGQRYAGADVATLYGYRNIGGGQQIDGSLSHGFPSWREDSKGGRYDNLS